MFFSLVKRLHLDGSYIRSWLILAIDLAVSATATLVAFLGIDYFVRNSGFSLLHYLFLLVSAFFCSAVAFYIFRTYRTVIRHSSLREVWKLGAATLLKELLMLFILWFWPDGMTFKAIGLCVVLDLFVTVCMLITVRVLMILLYDAIILSHIRRTNRIRTLVYGVESKEVALVMRLQNSPHYDMCGFITYGRRLKYYEIAERPVYYFETEENIEYVLDKFGIEAILFGNYANAKAESDRLIKYCVTHGVKVLIAPPIDEIVDGKLAHQGGIRDIKIEDLLGREEIKISLGEIMDNFRDKTVLVTGAAADARDTPRNGGSFSRSEIRPRDRRRADSETAGLRLPYLSAPGGIPCRGLQARAAHGGESLRSGAGQRRRIAQRGGPLYSLRRGEDGDDFDG